MLNVEEFNLEDYDVKNMQKDKYSERLPNFNRGVFELRPPTNLFGNEEMKI